MGWEMSETERPLAELLDEYRATKRAANLVRGLIPLGIILIFVIFVLVIYGRVKAFDDEAFVSHLGERATTLVPRVYDAIVEVGADVLPVYSAELEKQIEGGMERISAVLDKEITSLEGNLSAHLTTSLKTFADQVSASHKELVMKEFPTLASDGATVYAITSAVDGAFEKWFFDQINGMFNRHVEALGSIHETAKKLRDDAVKGDKKRVTGEEVLGLWLEVINHKIETETADEPDPAAKPVRQRGKKRG